MPESPLSPTQTLPVAREVRYNNCGVNVVEKEGGARELQFLDQSATLHIFNFNSDAARTVGNQLATILHVAKPEDIP